MSKELEALENIKNLFIGSPIDMSNEFEIIELAIKRAQHYINSYATLTRHIEVANTLISSYQKKLKALEIIKKIVKHDIEVNGNTDIPKYEQNEVITKEEYELLKQELE